jgi:glyoxylase-like metal-dependent hydrolase (beta-lactamase superfamily II)
VTYTGNVTVGGPADSRELGGGLTVTKLAVGEMNNNAYLLTDGSGTGRLIELVGDIPLAKIVTTHQHADHWQGLAAVRAATNAVTVAHPADAPGIPVPTDELVSDGGVIAFGDATLSVIHLVGHTPGSIALVIDPDGPAPQLFTGDCLFPGGPGRTTTPETFNSLMGGLETKIFGQLPDATWVYPGHGADTTLGTERPHLEEWRERGW